jgi:hypothetical protein
VTRNRNADFVDNACELTQMDLEGALAAQREKRAEGPRYTGKCLACGEETDERRRWCDAECRDDWEQGVRPWD